jgi:uncharacterized protein
VSTESEILKTYRTIAVVGLSSDPATPSNEVSAYMQAQGYRVIPINPNESEVLGERAYPDLASVPEPVEFVNVFRRAEACGQVARDAASAGAKALWLQLGIRSTEARRIADAAGITYVEDRCVEIEHQRGGIGRV